MAPLNRSSSLPRHFLFMLPASVSATERAAIVASARRLTTRGYVYIASPEEATPEDREDIRYLPLHEDTLPCFGSVTAVCVLRDEGLAAAARQAYPGTEVLVVDPLGGQQEEGGEKPASPWMAAAAGGAESAISQAA